MLFAWIAAALAGECTLTAVVDAEGQLALANRGTCPPHTYLQLKNSLGQDRPLPFPEHTLVQLPVTLADGAAYVAPAREGVLIGDVPDTPDVSHLVVSAPELPQDCSVLAHVDADGDVLGVRPMACKVDDYRLARRRAKRSRFEPSAAGGHAILPSDPDRVGEAVVNLEEAAADVP